MRCPKCGYISFDQIDKCLRCGKNIENTSAEVNGAVYNVPAPNYLIMTPSADVGEEVAGDEMDFSSDDVVLGAEAVEEVDFNFDDAETAAAAPVQVEDPGEEGGIEMDTDFFATPAAEEPVAEVFEVEEEGEETLSLSLDDAELSHGEEFVSERPFEEHESLEFDDGGMELSLDVDFDDVPETPPTPAAASPLGELSMDDFDLDLDLGDLDLGLGNDSKK